MGKEKHEKNVNAEETEQESVTATLEDKNEQLVRALADSENRQKILERERDLSVRYAVADFAKSLLDVVDALESAAQSCQGRTLTGEAHTLNEGIVLTQSVLMKVFKKHKIDVIAPEPGETFDHGRHQAISQEDSDFDEGAIVTVLRQGYFLQERLLRAAFVSVSSGKKPAKN